MADPMGGTAPPGRAEPVEGRLVQVRSDDRRPLLLGVIVVTRSSPSPCSSRGPIPATPRGLPRRTRTRPRLPAKRPPPRVRRQRRRPRHPATVRRAGSATPGADWRVFALEMRTGQSVQHWLSIEPGSAGSPRDPAVPLVRIVTDRLLALGFCVGSGPDGPRPLVGVRAWALAPEGPAVPVALAPLIEYMPRRVDLGAAYRPPQGSRGEAGPRGEADSGWSPGRYVFAVRQGPGQSDEQWFGVEVLAARQVSVAP